MKQLIEKIRNSDEATKQRWTVGLTGAASVLVVALWMGYVAVSVPEIERPKGGVVAQSAKKRVVKETPGVIAVFGTGVRAITSGVGSRVSRGIATVRQTVGQLVKANTVEVRVQEPNFVLEGMEEIPETPLP